jgi:pimeloyl-ACP methyl ester carboxylesterase
MLFPSREQRAAENMPFLDTDGATIHYSRDGQGPPVLLIQGVGVVGNGWRPQIDGLSDRHTLVAFDNRGFGQSTIRDGTLTIEKMAEDALALMDSQRFDRFHVVGHSMGGVIAQEVALRAPERVLSLAFMCTFARGKEGAAMSVPMLVTSLRMRIGTRAMRRNAFLELIMPARYLDEIDRAELAATLAPLFGYDLANQPFFVMQQLKAMARYDAGARLATLSAIPTIVVSASEDRVAPAKNGRALAAAIPGAKYIELEGAGHGVTIHRSGDINRLLADHFATELRSPARR